MKQIVQWYKSIKAEAECVTCQRWEHSIKPDEIEFHHIDHVQLHDAEKAGNTPLLSDRFDLIHDDQYQKLNGQFWQMVIAKAPPALRNEIHENLLDMLEDGRIIMGPRGFQLAGQQLTI